MNFTLWRNLRLYVLVCACTFISANLFANDSRQLWTEAEAARLGTPGVAVSVYRAMHLDLASLRTLLATAPSEQLVAVRQSQFVISLPLPDGGLGSFRVVDAPIMHPTLATKYPDIKTYLGQGLDDRTATVRFSITQFGLHAQILSASGTMLINPWNSATTSDYIVFRKSNAMPSTEILQCTFVPTTEEEIVSQQILESLRNDNTLQTTSIGHELRTYRMALASTGEYTSFHGGTKASGLAAMVVAMTRVNGIYEAEVDIRMVLIANNDTLVYTSSGSDPYTNNNGSTMLGQNQTTLDNIIGSANYDIGHVFSTGGGGVAGLRVPCVTGQKARGVTGLSSPVGDPFYVDYVAHEMGHQWGGNHTFNGSSGSCSGNRSASAAYEPGSGTTIMAYAGICGANNTQNFSDPYFHTKSFDEIVTYSTVNTGNTCAVTTLTGNTGPVVLTTPDYYIPYLTPFMLTGSATDIDGDTLTYCWEQYDLGPAGAPNTPTGDAPIFRSFNPTLSPTRYFPRLQNIVNNTQTIGEILPSYARTLNFKVTARDNVAGGAGVNHNNTSVKVYVINTGAPFLVTSPNTAVVWLMGTQETVTWDVVGTTAAPISAGNVDILLSLDGGFTYPVTLATAVPNNGSAMVTVPALATTQARVMVRGEGNIFFDISNTNFSIDVSSGVAEAGIANSIEVYPNPATEDLNIILGEQLNGVITVELIDLAGRIINSSVHQSDGTKQKIIFPLTHLEQGIYQVRINSVRGQAVKRIVKM